MPRTGKPAKGKGRLSNAAPDLLAVRMLTGAHAGQVVSVTREEAVRLCDGWTPQAELVARSAASQRETR